MFDPSKESCSFLRQVAFMVCGWYGSDVISLVQRQVSGLPQNYGYSFVINNLWLHGCLLMAHNMLIVAS